MASLLVRGSPEPLRGRLSKGKRGARSNAKKNNALSTSGCFYLYLYLQPSNWSVFLLWCLRPKWQQDPEGLHFGRSCPCTSGEVWCTAWVEVTHVGLAPDLRVKLSQRWSHWRCAALPQAWQLELETAHARARACSIVKCCNVCSILLVQLGEV